MISWIQRTFQRHFRILFMVLLAVIIVSFVFVIGNQPGIGQGKQKRLKREFFGYDLSADKDAQAIGRDASLSMLLQLGQLPRQSEQLQQYALQRQAALYLANELNVPEPTADQLTTFIRSLGGFAGDTGEFNATAYQQFRDSLVANPQTTEADVARVIKGDWRADQVRTLLAGPGYVLPAEVADQLVEGGTEWTVSVATVDYANFNPEIATPGTAIADYFANNSGRYAIPEKVRVAYAEFPVTRYMSQVPVSETELRAYYDANPSLFPKQVEPNKDETKPLFNADDMGGRSDADYIIARPQVENRLRLEGARKLALKAGSDVALSLYNDKVTLADVGTYLAAKGITLKNTQPFSAQTGAVEIGGNHQVTTEAFNLDAERYFSDAILSPAGAVVLIWQETLPSREAELTEVREQVVTDYVANEKRKRFIAAGQKVRDAITAALPTAESFAAAVKSASADSALTITAKDYDTFTPRQPPTDLSSAAVNAMRTLDVGKVSPMVTDPSNQGLIVYVKNKVAPAVGPGNPEFETTQGQLANFTSMRNAGSYLNELVTAELAKSDPSLAE